MLFLNLVLVAASLLGVNSQDTFTDGVDGPITSTDTLVDTSTTFLTTETSTTLTSETRFESTTTSSSISVTTTEGEIVTGIANFTKPLTI
jgi:hypothetical protein